MDTLGQAMPNNNLPVQVRVASHGPKDKRYRISRMGALVCESKPYRASDSAVKALKALKSRLARRKYWRPRAASGMSKSPVGTAPL